MIYFLYMGVLYFSQKAYQKYPGTSRFINVSQLNSAVVQKVSQHRGMDPMNSGMTNAFQYILITLRQSDLKMTDKRQGLL